MPSPSRVRRPEGAPDDDPARHPHRTDRTARPAHHAHAIVDALHRFAAGQELDDRELFLSAFTADARLDFTQPAALFDADVPPMHGRDAIAGIMDTLAPLRTTHTVTNPRVQVRGEEADLMALVEAQHVAADRRHLLLKNIYLVRAVRRASTWLIADLTIENVWWDGDPSVLFPR